MVDHHYIHGSLHPFLPCMIHEKFVHAPTLHLDSYELMGLRNFRQPGNNKLKICACMWTTSMWTSLKIWGLLMETPLECMRRGYSIIWHKSDIPDKCLRIQNHAPLPFPRYLFFAPCEPNFWYSHISKGRDWSRLSIYHCSDTFSSSIHRCNPATCVRIKKSLSRLVVSETANTAAMVKMSSEL